MNSARRNAGYVLITSLIVTAIVTAFVVGFISIVNTEQKISRNDTEYSSAFYAAEAGLEKLNSDLSKLFQRSVFPTQTQIGLLMSSASEPVLTGITYSAYEVTGGQSTNLSAALNASATTVGVNSTTSWPTSGYFMIDSEEFTYSGITSNSFTGVIRGASNSTAAAHTSGAIVTRAKVITIAEGPSAGLSAQVIPFTIEVTADTRAGAEARLRRKCKSR